jgi:hypothetical protein
VVDSKFGSFWGRWCSNESLRAFGVELSNNIRKGWRRFSSHTKFEVRDDFKVRF